MTPFQSSSQALLAEAVNALSSVPHFTETQKQIRSEAVVCGIMAFLPFEPVQVILASQATGHHFALLDTFRDLGARTLPESLSHRMRAISTVQTRTVLSVIKELRIVRKEMQAAGEAEQARMASAAGTPAASQAVPVPGSAPAAAEGHRPASGPAANSPPAPAQTKPAGPAVNGTVSAQTPVPAPAGDAAGVRASLPGSVKTGLPLAAGLNAAPAPGPVTEGATRAALKAGTAMSPPGPVSSGSAAAAIAPGSSLLPRDHAAQGTRMAGNGPGAARVPAPPAPQAVLRTPPGQTGGDARIMADMAALRAAVDSSHGTIPEHDATKRQAAVADAERKENAPPGLGTTAQAETRAVADAD